MINFALLFILFIILCICFQMRSKETFEDSYLSHKINFKKIVDKDNEIISNKFNTNINKCSFIAKGIKEIDCFKSCHGETDINDCSVADCLEKCSKCNNPDDCNWKVKPIALERPAPKRTIETVNKCTFAPYGNSPTQCVQICSGEKRGEWGGDLCTDLKCKEICSDCNNKDWCLWLDKEFSSDFPPEPPRLMGIAGINAITLLWNSTISDVNDIHNIYYYKTGYPDEKVQMITMSHKTGLKSQYTMNIDSLKRDTDYTFFITAINKNGSSPKSNNVILRLKNNLPKNLVFSLNKGDYNVNNLGSTTNIINRNLDYEYIDSKLPQLDRPKNLKILDELKGKTVNLTI